MNKRADYNVGTIENKVEMQVKDAVNSIEKLVGSLGTLKSALNDTFNMSNNNKPKDKIEEMLKTVNSFKKALNLSAVWIGLKKGWDITKNLANANIDMIETSNLFEVSMGKVVDQYGELDVEASKYYTKALEFQDEMNEKLATNKSELMKFQAMYYSMFKSQNINKDASYFMSEQLTKAGYDIASLYNLTVDDAMDKIKSGIAGQVEPLRKIGIDISESALTKVIRDAGITNRNVQQLSYAEKEVARYIAIVEQAGQAQGDFAKTFEQPANQIRVFKNQLAELKQVAGAFIINTFKNVIVYANAVVMTLKEILKAFATLFGYDLSSGGSDLSGSITDVDDGLGSAVGKAKELKKQLMGFDEINNIAPQSDSASGSGNIVGIDEKLLNSLQEWDNKMDSISGKAQQIRDRMLEWLGFKRNDDNTWKLGEGITNFEKILDIVKMIGVAILGWKVSNAVASIFSGLGLISETQQFTTAFGTTLLLSGIFAQYKGTEHLLDGEINLFTIMESVLGTAGGTLGLVNLLNASKTGKEIPLPNKIGISAGIMLLLQGLQAVVDGLKDSDILKQITGALEMGVGSGLITAVKGGIKVGLKAGLLVTLAIVDVELLLNIIKWWREYFDEQKKEIYGNKEKLNLGEMIYVGLNAVGQGAWQAIDNLFGEGTYQKAINWTAGVMTECKKLGDSIEEWWENDIAPWFTVEKWEQLIWGAVTAINRKVSEWKGSFKIVEDWWNEDIKPWFTVEKWESLMWNAISGMNNKISEWKNNFKVIENWWNENIAPWFTWEKWQQLGKNSMDALKNKITDFKNNFNPISDWWNNKVLPWFTLEKWKGLGRDAVNGIQSVFSNFDFKIKIPHFTWTSTPASGWISDVLSALNLPTSLPKLNVSWYASGGMPDKGEIFVAREKGAEMVGRIGNRTTVANNDQIVSAIKQGVYEAVTSAMPNNTNEIHLDIRADEGIIVQKASEGFADYVMQTGELPFPVPV